MAKARFGADLYVDGEVELEDDLLVGGDGFIDGDLEVTGQGKFLADLVAPFVVVSSVLVTNLNADLLDGQHGAYYRDLANATGVLVPTKGGTGLSALGTAGQLIRVNSGGSALEYFTPNYLGADLLGVANGIATLDNTGKIPISQLPSTGMQYMGMWDASTNTPPLSDGTGSEGQFYRVTTGGTVNLGSGTITFTAGDDVIHNGVSWQRAPSASNASNLGIGTRTATDLPITNSNGTGVTLPVATNTLAGLMSAADKVLLGDLQTASHPAASLSGTGYLSLNPTTQVFTASPINLTLHVTGVLPIASGGTGLSTLGTALQVLRVNAGATGLEYATLTIPTVNNGTLNLATGAGLTGSAVFTANQSGNSTFTVGLDVNLSNLNAVTGTGFLRRTGTNTWAIDTSTYLTAAALNDYYTKSQADSIFLTENQTITLTGDVTGSGKTSITTALRNSAGLSVIGRSANSTGAPADIVASDSGDVLRRSGSTLGFGTIGNASITDLNWSKIYGTPTTLADYGIQSDADSRYVAKTVQVVAGNGMTGGGALSGNVTVTLGTPGAITLSSTNSVTSTSHTHAFTPGGTTSQYIRGDGSLATFPLLPDNYVTTDTNQTNLGGNKTWVGRHTWHLSTNAAPVAEPATIQTARAATGIYLTGYDLDANQAFIFRTGEASGIQLALLRGGVSTLSHGTSANWYQAYQWGNHATAGYVPQTRLIGVGTGLSGGGALSSDVTISLGTNLANLNALNTNGLVRKTGANTWTIDTSTYLTSVAIGDITGITISTPANGQVLTYNGSAWVNASLPAPPTVNDGTLTLATDTGLTGSASFSANQSGNATFTVGLGTNLSNLNALSASGFVKKTGADTWAIDTNTYLTGTGTTGYLPKWGSSSSLNDSVIYQDGNNRIGIGTTTMDVKLVVDGGFAVYGNSAVRPDSGGNGVFNVWRDIVVGDTVNDVHGTIFIHDGLGTPFKDNNAAFEIRSTTKGLLFPRMTATQRDAITGPAGMVVYNTTANVLSMHNGSAWVNLGVGTGSVTTVSAGAGMDFTSITTSGAVALGTPSPITLASTNSVSGTTHTHAFQPGGTSSQYIAGDGTLQNFPALPTNYVTTDSNQTGLSGNKYWTGQHKWTLASNVSPTVEASSISMARGATGIYLTGYDLDAVQAFVLRTGEASGIQLTLSKGGVSTPNHGNSSQWNLAYSKIGNTVIGLSVGYSGSITIARDSGSNLSANIVSIRAIDTRTDWTGSSNDLNYFPAPSSTDLNRSLTLSFGNGWGGTSTGSILTAKGWNGSYAAWRIGGPASATTPTTEDLYISTGIGSSWNPWRKIFHSGNFATGTTAQYIRGDGSLAAFPTIPAVGDGTLTLNTGTGLTGSATFSANQSGNATFTVGLSSATSSAIGGVKLYSDVVQSVGANAVSSTTGRTYGVQMNASGQLVVNVPWANDNTTYTASNGIQLTGTEFSPVYGVTAGTIAEGNHTHFLGQLADVSYFIINEGQVLGWSGSVWEPTTIPDPNNGTLTLSVGPGLTGSALFSANQASNSSFTVGLDTNLSNLNAITGTGFLKRTGSNTWAVDNSTYLTSVALGDITNVSLSSPTNGQALVYNGTNWVNTTLPSAPSNYVTSNSNQTGLSGNKEWTGNHTFTSGRIDLKAADPGQIDLYFHKGANIQWNIRNGAAGNIDFNRYVGGALQGSAFSINNSTGNVSISSLAGSGTAVVGLTSGGVLTRRPDSDFLQTLSLGLSPGQIQLTSGGDVTLTSLGRVLVSDFSSHVFGAGFHAVANTAGSTGYPNENGGGFRYQRGTSQTQYDFEIWKGNTGKLYYNASTGTSAWQGWKTFATEDWVEAKGYITSAAIGNGTLTLGAGTGLTGSASFSANQSGNATFTVGLGTNLSNLNALSTSGIVRKTGVNTWTIDTATYLTSAVLSDYYTKSETDGRYVQKAGDTMTGNLQMNAGGNAVIFGGGSGGNGGYIWGSNNSGTLGLGLFMTYNGVRSGTDIIQPRGTNPTHLLTLINNIGLEYKYAAASGTDGSIVTPTRAFRVQGNGNTEVVGQLQIGNIPDSTGVAVLTVLAGGNVRKATAAQIVEAAGSFVPTSRIINTGDGLSGGGNLGSDRTISLNTMTATTIGGAKLFSNTVQSVAANAVSSASSRTYGIQLNSSGQLVVNVPWTDNNTTYSGSNGIQLSGTTFSPVYGTTSGTVAQGNDSRIVNAVQTSRAINTTNSIQGGGNLSANRTLQLVGDSGTPGGNKYYGTNDDGVKGFWDLPNLSGYVQTSRQVNTSGSLQGGGNLGSNRTLSLVNDSGSPGGNKYYGTNGDGVKGFWDMPNLSGYVPTSRVLTINGVAQSLSSNRSWNVGNITGGGSNGYIPKFNGSSDLNNSQIYQDGSGNVAIGTTDTAGVKLHVWGNLRVGSGIYASQNIQTGSHFMGSWAILSGSLDVSGSDSRIGGGTSAVCAVLTLNSTSRGLLLPRMTYAQRIAITSPQNGLMVYQTNDVSGANAGFWGYEKGTWRRFHMVTP